jgi:hypothetical protein
LPGPGESKKDIKQYIEATFNYDLSATLAEIRPHYRFDPTCQGTVPQAIIAFLASNNYEDAVHKAISLGGDSDTIGCITGGVAQAYYKIISDNIEKKVRELLDARLFNILDLFRSPIIVNPSQLLNIKFISINTIKQTQGLCKFKKASAGYHLIFVYYYG